MAKFFNLLRGMGNKVKNTGSNLFDMLRREEPQEVEFTPLPKVEGADDRGLMPDGSLAQSQPLQLEYIQVDEKGQQIPNAQFHPMNTTQPVTNNGLFSKIANKTVDAVFGKQAPATDNVNANTMEVTVSDNPRVGGLINDITGGYRENRDNAFNLENWGNNDLGNNREKGLAYRIGEGAGTLGRGLRRAGGALGRFADTPLGRAAIMAGVVGATGGSGLQALAYGGTAGLGNQVNRMKDRAYRDSLINSAQQSRMGQPDWVNLSPEQQQAEMQAIVDKVNSYRGYITDDVYRNMVDSQIAQENAAYRRMYYDVQAEQGKQNQQLAQEKFDYQKEQDAIKNAQKWTEINNDKQKANSGRVMPASSATGLSGTQQGINQMTTLMEQIPKFAKRGLAGPVGSLRRFNPYDADAQAFQQYVNTYKQVIGKGLEGGVLRKEDEAKYEKIIPRMGDTEEVLMRKAQQLQQMLVEKYNTDLESLYNAGYDTGNFSYLGGQPASNNSKSGVTKSGVKYEVIE